MWICGALLTLVPSLWAIVAGLAIAAGCGFITQATSTALVALTAESGRTSAIGLYATCFYVGGGFGATLPGLAWKRAAGPPRRDGDRDAAVHGGHDPPRLEALSMDRGGWEKKIEKQPHAKNISMRSYSDYSP